MQLQVRHYQEKSLNALREGYRSGYKSQILYMPTGAGKTECAISVMKATQDAGNRVAMVMDRRVLVEQTSQRLEKYGIDHGVLMSGHWRYRTDKLIQICSAQTLEARGSFPGLKLLIVDEAHELRKSIIDFIKSSGVRTIGLSASPFTKGLGSVYSNVISEVTTRELVNEESLVPLRVFIAKEIDMTGAKKIAGEWSSNESTGRGIKITGDIVTEWVKKTFEIFGKAEKTIVFCAGVAHGADLQDKFAQAGFNFIALSHLDDDDYKTQVYAEFAKPDTDINGIIATDLLTKGYDQADIRIGISSRPFTKSLSSHIQQMGRVMRPYPGKEFALWLDHSGNYLRFKDDWEDLYNNGVDGLDDGREKPKKEPSKEEKEAAKCPKCSHIWPSNSDACSFCGFVRQRRNEVSVKPGDLIELGDTLKKEADFRRSFFHQLLTYQDSKPKYKDNWARVKFHEKFGEWPKFDETREPLSPTVRKWIISRFIKYSKSVNK